MGQCESQPCLIWPFLCVKHFSLFSAELKVYAGTLEIPYLIVPNVQSNTINNNNWSNQYAVVIDLNVPLLIRTTTVQKSFTSHRCFYTRKNKLASICDTHCCVNTVMPKRRLYHTCQHFQAISEQDRRKMFQ